MNVTNRPAYLPVQTGSRQAKLELEAKMQLGQQFNPYRLFVGAFIPNCLIRYKDLSASAKLLWARLAQYAGEDGRCYPSQTTLAEELGMTKRQVIRLLNELQRRKFIAVEKPNGKQECEQKTNKYYFLWHECFNDWPGHIGTLEGPKRIINSDINVTTPGDINVTTPGDIRVTTLGDIHVTPPVTCVSPKDKNIRESYKDKKDSIAQSDFKSNRSEPPCITLPLADKSDHPIDQSKIDELSEIYPGVDVKRELLKAKGWLIANPTRRKTARGIGRFIHIWLSKAQDSVYAYLPGQTGTGTRVGMGKAKCDILDLELAKAIQAELHEQTGLPEQTGTEKEP